MKSYRIILAVLLLLGASFANAPKKLGEAISLEKTVAITDILNKPEAFLGKTVLVKGRVIDVCKKRGCWMKIAADSGYGSLLIKVKDGEIVFPLEASGKVARVQGVMEKVEFTLEETRVQQKEQCEIKGKKFDPAKVTQPRVIYRLHALGAEIEM